MSEVTVQAAARPAAARPRVGVLCAAPLEPHALQAVVAAGAAELVAVAGPGAGGRAADWIPPGAVRLASLEDLLAQPLDGVVVAAPAAEQAAVITRVLDQGRPVFCRRPPGRTAAETRDVIARARANDRLLAVDLSLRFTEAMRVLRSVIQAGELGDPFAVDLVFHATRKPVDGPARTGGALDGCVLALGAQMLDLALWTLGFPRVTGVSSRLHARGEPVRPGATGAPEDYAAALLELDTGVTIRLACSWNLPSGRDAVIEASFYGTEGGGTFRNVNGSSHDFTAELFRGTSRHALAVPPDDWHGRAAIEWAERVGRGQRYDPWIEGQIDVAAAVDAVTARPFAAARGA